VRYFFYELGYLGYSGGCDGLNLDPFGELANCNEYVVEAANNYLEAPH
jgi:hypothetical protein